MADFKLCTAIRDEWECHHDIIDLHVQRTRAQTEYKMPADWRILPSVSLLKNTFALYVSGTDKYRTGRNPLGNITPWLKADIKRHQCRLTFLWFSISSKSYGEFHSISDYFTWVVQIGLQCSTMRKPGRTRALHSTQWFSAVSNPSGTVAMMYDPPFTYHHVPLRKTSAFAIHAEALLAAGVNELRCEMR